MSGINDKTITRVCRALEVLSRHLPVAAAYFFGSQVNGTADEYSDVDIGVFIKEVRGWNLLKQARCNALAQKVAGDDLEFHYFPAGALRRPDPAGLAAYVLRHGIPIPRRPRNPAQRLSDAVKRRNGSPEVS